MTGVLIKRENLETDKGRTPSGDEGRDRGGMSTSERTTRSQVIDVEQVLPHTLQEKSTPKTI